MIPRIVCFVLSFFIFQFCSVRPALVDFEKVDKLQRDKKFIFIKTKAFKQLKTKKLETYEAKEDFLAQSKALYDRNNIAIYQIKQAKADKAEANLKEVLDKKPTHFVATLNLLRLYYLVEDYELVRRHYDRYLKEIDADKKKVFSLISYLEKKNRIEEKVLFLDVLVTYKNLEIEALEQLGLYFLENRDFYNAEMYFEKLLQIDSFNLIALQSMMQISFEKDEWDAVILYGSTLDKLRSSGEDYFYYMAKAYYETKEFGKAIQVSRLAARKNKMDYDILLVWRDSILCNDISAPIGHLKKYFPQVLKGGREIDKEKFFLLDTKMGRKVLFNIVHGR